MKRIIYTAATCLLAVSCATAPSGDEATDDFSEPLNGILSTGGNLTKKSYVDTNEANREADTTAYYNAVRTGSNGTSGGTIASSLGTLSAFSSFYGFGSGPQAFYYNRGDLGIGREMHCVDQINTANQQIACYVKNFSAGDNDSEFRFGQSSNVAFANLNAGNAFATVAMVYRNLAPAKDKVFFVVYGPTGVLTNVAALDRHGFNFAKGLPDNHGNFGTPGLNGNFNNHIPSNCVSCHGGQAYDHTTHSETGALFLPFDLDQFEYENVSGRTRADQLVAFQHLNEIVRKVAALSGSPGASSLKAQLDGWYSNTPGSNAKTEVFENPFNPAFVPAGWSTASSVYSSVVRGSCRNCHMVQGTFPFDTSAQFLSVANASAVDLCAYRMPHALQSVRLFWQSTEPDALKAFYNANGQSGAASSLGNCGPGDVATLDPQHIMASSVLF